jgi:hypothetical protein
MTSAKGSDLAKLVWRVNSLAIANAQVRAERRGIAHEQAALRRVASLVAEAAQPADVFAAVARRSGGSFPPT